MGPATGQLLIVGDAPPIFDPPWETVEEVLGRVTPTTSVILYKADKRHIRADGARALYTIVFYENAHAPSLIIGRRDSGPRRGKPVVHGQRVLVSAFEYWARDGVDVFRAFYDDKPLAESFTLRDPRAEHSSEEIRRML